MKLPALIASVALVLTLTACGSGGTSSNQSAQAMVSSSSNSSSSSTSTATKGATAQPLATGSSQGTYTLIQEPDAGFAALYTFIRSARTSVDMTMYELNDTQAISALEADAARGVKVRVILDKDFSGGKSNAAAYANLQAHTVAVKWAPATTIYHQKTIVVDDKVAAVGTANFTSQYYSSSRDAWIIDKNTTQAHAIDATFTNDYGVTKRTGTSVSAAGLVWSPGAESAMVNLINSAHKTLDVTSEEFKEYNVVGAVAAAAKRGVKCEVVLTASSEWNADFKYVQNAGCQVHVFPDSVKALYMHEKIILVDGKTLLIGSQNIGTYSLTRNRELSLLLTSAQAPKVLASVGSTFAKDYAAAANFAG